ncbi:hypothetical protein O1611_g5546 [Lasiodiplodia mahajangana]|uniref:Uncharacterized protein n=1 Tax=Lasiodiplodia mahajangana TaxID=1108764 RepID=A0ACC2JKM3_9PEZI|nr:hypothetical protein O1611_g5546 [Lasiodiplodia mahajangana]
MGIEIDIHRLEGKHKMSQEMGGEDRQGIIDGFELLGNDLWREVAPMVKERGALKDKETAAKAGSSHTSLYSRA